MNKKLKFEVHCAWADYTATSSSGTAYADSADEVISYAAKFIEDACGVAESIKVDFCGEDDNAIDVFQWDNSCLPRNQDMLDDWKSIERDLKKVCKKLLKEKK